MEIQPVKCKPCKGVGIIPQYITSDMTCKNCNGKGTFNNYRHIKKSKEICLPCHGTGKRMLRIEYNKCLNCDGKGWNENVNYRSSKKKEKSTEKNRFPTSFVVETPFSYY